MNGIKYPRTPHLPWSPGGTRDDLRWQDTTPFDGNVVCVTEKMDGESFSLYRNRLHARSLNWSPHPARHWIAGLHAQIKADIPEGWRVCGESLFAKHSIHYTNLPSYFLVFSVWNEHNRCLSWYETIEWTQLLGLQTVPVLYTGPWNPNVVRKILTPYENSTEHEGYVVRLAETFHYAAFAESVAKYVRPGHVDEREDHWMARQIVQNGLKD